MAQKTVRETSKQDISVKALPGLFRQTIMQPTTEQIKWKMIPHWWLKNAQK